MTGGIRIRPNIRLSEALEGRGVGVYVILRIRQEMFKPHLPGSTAGSMMVSRSVLVALLVLTACRDLSGPKTELRISGIVTDVSTGARISGATVTLENIEILLFPSSPIINTTTDSQGHYSLTWTSDTYCLEILRLRVSADGYYESFTNQASGNNIRCTSSEQILNVQLIHR